MKKYVVGVLMERIVFDIMGLLLEIEKRDCYILVIVDYFIKWIEVGLGSCDFCISIY